MHKCNHLSNVLIVFQRFECMCLWSIFHMQACSFIFIFAAVYLMNTHNLVNRMCSIEFDRYASAYCSTYVPIRYIWFFFCILYEVEARAYMYLFYIQRTTVYIVFEKERKKRPNVMRSKAGKIIPFSYGTRGRRVKK